LPTNKKEEPIIHQQEINQEQQTQTVSNDIDDPEIKLPKLKPWKELPVKKKVIGIICIILLLGVLVGLVMFKDTLMTTKQSFKYPDGCIENYTNGIIITDNCTIGREMIAQYGQRHLPSMNQSFRMPN
jgi:hypothetical protein